MHAIQQAKQQVLKELKKAVGKEYSPTVEDLSYPTDSKHGDLSFACFALAKGLKRNPAEIANEIAAKIGPKGFIKSVASVGPYVNFMLDDSEFGGAVMEEIVREGDAYGTSEIGEGKRVMVEYANLNTHKDVHIGHLRNLLVGQMTVAALRANGYDVVPVTYINDLGAAAAKCVWAVKNLSNGDAPEGEDRITFMQRMYVEANARAETDPAAKEEISNVQRELETGRGPFRTVWKKTHGWSVKYLKEVFKEFGLPLDVWFFEHELIEDTKRIVEDLIARGIVTSSQGAWIVDLEDEKLGANLLVKSDGTFLYNAKDLALALRKEEQFHPARSIIVLDARQTLVMQQLFATMKRMGFTKELQHLSYEFVTLKEGAMSSRKGNIMRYETFRDEMLNMASDETRKRHANWTEKKIAKVARAIAFSAIRFGMLKQDLEKKITFDMQEAVSFDGFTGPYLLYSYARMNSILKKGSKARRFEESKVSATLPVEHRLALALSKYPEAVFAAGQTLRLSVVTQYVFDLCKTFSEFYDQAPVLGAEPEIAAFRLRLVSAASQTLENGLGLLGIDPVSEM